VTKSEQIEFINTLEIASGMLAARISSGMHPQDVDTQACEDCFLAAQKLIVTANVLVKNKLPETIIKYEHVVCYGIDFCIECGKKMDGPNGKA
jgi:hypothetical protein